jgi:hypothetical protein
MNLTGTDTQYITIFSKKQVRGNVTKKTRSITDQVRQHIEISRKNDRIKEQFS